MRQKKKLAELVDFLRDPTKFQNLGGRIPRGVLMVGSRVYRLKPCWRKQLAARQKCRSFHFRF